MSDDRPDDTLVWDIFENAWVTLAYWRWVHGKDK